MVHTSIDSIVCIWLHGIRISETPEISKVHEHAISAMDYIGDACTGI
jgi:hypothetical protein